MALRRHQSYVQTDRAEVGDIDKLRRDVNDLKQGSTDAGASPTTLVEPSGAWPIGWFPAKKKNDVVNILRFSVDPKMTAVKAVIEEYEYDGVDVTVTKKHTDEMEFTQNDVGVSGSAYVVELEFGPKLEANTQYGLLRASGSFDEGDHRKFNLKNPVTAPPAKSSRVLSDYLTTWNSTEGNRVVPQGSSPENILKNGAFTYADDAPAPATDLRKWTTASADATITTTNTDDVYWDDANARGAIQAANDGFQQTIGRRVKRGEILNISLDVLGSTTFTADIDIDVVDSGGSSILTTPSSIVADLTTTPMRFNVPVQIDDAADLSGNQGFFITTPTTLHNDGGGGTGRKIFMTNIMFSHGAEPQPFARQPGEEGRGGSDSYDRTITGITSNPDTGAGIVDFDIGEGGPIYVI